MKSMINHPNENATSSSNTRRRRNCKNNNPTSSNNSGTDININNPVTLDQFTTRIDDMNNNNTNNSNNSDTNELDNKDSISIAEEIDLPITTETKANIATTPILYWVINASNYQQFNLNWNKFDTFSYSTKRHQSILIKDTI
ncbi:hypothetical protein C6P45_001079 [Maudiozyma exigua]|uniref:Uncharacterized protein n=1 Tax=Maudiozyma exigua TaxID=34358 RepID=A0A9P6W3B3_MAUEX|nr:hypothetical protein C6P45_001079 [Kazachstania exigua]